MAIDEDNAVITQAPHGDTVGVLIDSVNGFFNNGAIACLIAAAAEHDIHLVFFFGGYIEKDKDCGESSYAYTLPDPSVLDALIVFPHNISPFSPDTLLHTILSHCAEIPIYALFGALPETFSVIPDETPAIEELVRHLAECHPKRKIAILSGPDAPKSISRRRIETIIALLDGYGIPIGSESILTGDFTLESGKQAVKRLLSGEGAMPEMLLCLNDEMAIGAIREFLNNGISVPEDIAIVGFDDIEEGAALPAHLSSISFPVWEMASALVARVASDLSGTTTYAPEILRFNTRFVQRESCGCTSRFITNGPDPAIPKAPQRAAVRGDNRKISALRHSLAEVIEECIASGNSTQFMAFLQQAVTELSRTGDIASSYIDLFSTQWTISALRHKEFNTQVFINSLFVDAFRFVMQMKTQLYANIHSNDLGTINFVQNCSALMTERLSVHETVKIIASNLPLLGIERCLMVFLSPNDPNQGELRLSYREGKQPDIPERDFLLFPISRLIPDGTDSFRMPIAILPLVHANTVYGYLAISMTNNRYEHFWRVQTLVSQIVDSAMASDLIENRIRTLTRTNDALSKLSIIDEFTGLYNRRALYATGRAMYEQARQRGDTCAFIFLDMDGLKKINDTFGHKEGDEAILALSTILKGCFRENDLVVRYGGDEFVVLMVNIKEASLKGAFSRITAQLKAFNGRAVHPWTLSTSWGHVFIEHADTERTFESIIEESDAKLYEEKRKKKERAKEASL